MLLQKILLSLKFPASRAKERGAQRQTGVERVRMGEQRGKQSELQKCEALELKLCLPGPTESR